MRETSPRFPSPNPQSCQTRLKQQTKTMTQSAIQPTVTTAAGTPGKILPGQFSGTFCFVPLTCLGKTEVDRMTYVKTGWATRNGRLNAGRCVGSHLFPREDAVLDQNDPRFARFLAEVERTPA